METKKEYRGLLVDLYYNPKYRACAGRGVTTKYDKFLVIGEGVDASTSPFTETDHEKILVIVKRHLHDGVYYNAVPLKYIDNPHWTMFGGNYIDTSDSRFKHKYPIPVHDRVEW
jgi:hypothetical protein